MADNLNAPKGHPEYFNVARPYHFRVRPDLVGELQVDEEMLRTRPTNAAEHKAWLLVAGETEQSFPLERFAGNACEPISHYLLQVVGLPGNSYPTNLVTDENGWTVRMEPGGLFQFVINRAIEFAVAAGCSHSIAAQNFRPANLVINNRTRRLARWGVGYEKGSGVCSILELSDTEAVGDHLEGALWFDTPFPNPLGPS